MKSFGKWLLLLLLLGGAAAVTAAAYERLRVAKLVEQIDAAKVVADSLEGVVATEKAAATVERVRADGWRDSAGVLDSAFRVRGRALERRTADLDAFLASHDAAVPDTIRVLILAERDEAQRVIAVCTEGWEACRRETDALRAASSADSAAFAALTLAYDTTRTALEAARRHLNPPLTFPRLALKVGRYAEHGLAIYGAVKLLDAAFSGGSDGGSQREYESCHVVSPLTLQLRWP